MLHVPIAPPPLTHRQILIDPRRPARRHGAGGLDQTIVATSLPTIVGDLGGLEDIAWVVTVVPAVRDGRDADLREALRRLRAAEAVPLRHRRVRHRLDAVRPRPEPGDARRLPRGAGRRRRRADLDGLRHDGRHHPAAGARPVHGVLQLGVRGDVGRRPAARRVPHRPRQLAVDLLRQRARSASAALVVTSRALRGPARRRRGDAASRLDVLGAALLVAGVGAAPRSPSSGVGNEHPLDLAVDPRPRSRRRRRRSPASSRGSGGPRTRSCRCACSATTSSPSSGGMAFLAGVVDVRGGHVPAAVPAGGEGRLGVELGVADRCRS